MRTITFTQDRWNNLQQNLLSLAQGNLNKKLIISHFNDDLEGIEVLVNMIIDEWKQRVLQMTFYKPIESQKFINHFQLLLNKKLQVIDSDDRFPEFMGIDLNSIMLKKFSDIVDHEMQQSFEKQIDSQFFLVPPNSEIHTLKLLGIPFMFNVKKTFKENNYIINLYQMQIDNTLYYKGMSRESAEFKKLEQKKRYQDIVQDIKQHIDQHPYSELIRFNTLCKNFGINSFQLKRGFQELYQTSVYDYFLKLRMKHAHMLIKTSTISLKEISQMVGYTHYSTFSSQFYKLFEIRPKEIRNKPTTSDEIN